MKIISEWTDNLVRRIPENVFVNVVLPIVLSPEPKKDLRPWIDLAGDPMLPMDVYNGDQFLFRVPPITGTPKIHQATHPRDSVFEIVATAKQKAEIVPAMGERYLDNRLGDKVEVKDASPHIAVWREILARYGHLKKVDSGTTETVKKTDVVDSELFTGQYDEL
jgi:hypothetical protein